MLRIRLVLGGDKSVNVIESANGLAREASGDKPAYHYQEGGGS